MLSIHCDQNSEEYTLYIVARVKGLCTLLEAEILVD